jgi:hypothetical protein
LVGGSGRAAGKRQASDSYREKKAALQHHGFVSWV